MNEFEKESDPQPLEFKNLSENNERFSGIKDFKEFKNNVNKNNLFEVPFDNGKTAIFKLDREFASDPEDAFKPTKSETAHISYLIAKLLEIDEMISPNIVCEITNLSGNKKSDFNLSNYKKIYGTMTEYYPFPPIDKGDFQLDFELKDEKYLFQIRRLIIFDMLTANYDRNTSNILIDNKNKKVIAIDHDDSFDNSNKSQRKYFEKNPKVAQIYKKSHRDIGINIDKIDKGFIRKLINLKSVENAKYLNNIFKFYNISGDASKGFYNRLERIISRLS